VGVPPPIAESGVPGADTALLLLAASEKVDDEVSVGRGTRRGRLPRKVMRSEFSMSP